MSVDVRVGRLGDVRIGGDDRVAGDGLTHDGAPPPSTWPGSGPSGSTTSWPSSRIGDAVHDDGADACRIGHQPVGAGGEVPHAPQRAAADGRGIEDDHVGGQARRQAAAVGEPEHRGGLPRQAIARRLRATARRARVPRCRAARWARTRRTAGSRARPRRRGRASSRDAASSSATTTGSVFRTAMRKRVSRSLASDEIEHEVDDVHAALRRDLAEMALRERRVGRMLGDLHVGEAAAERPHGAALAQRAAEVGIGVQPSLARAIRLRDRPEERHALEREGRLHLELDGERPAGDLRDHRDAVRLERGRLRQHAAMAVGSEHAAEERGPRHRAAGARGQWPRARRGRTRGRWSPASRRDRPRRDSRRASRSPPATPRGSAPAGPRRRRGWATSRSRSRARRGEARRATRARMAAISSAVASRSVASSPIT